MIKSRLFGYLVVTAAGSIVLALVDVANQLAGFSVDWGSAGLALLAVGLVGLSHKLDAWYPPLKEDVASLEEGEGEENTEDSEQVGLEVEKSALP